MTVMLTKFRILGVLTALAPAVLTLGACASDPAGAGELEEACNQIFAGQYASPEVEVVIVDDRTASVVAHGLPTVVADAIVDASRRGGTITIVGVEGEGRAPRLVANELALSEEGPRDRPSVEDVARAMPYCVESLLEDTAPEGEGSDLHEALATAVDAAPADMPIFVVSDMLSTAGRWDVTGGALLEMAPDEASAATAAVAGLDFGGRRVHLIGVGASTTPLLSHSREWLDGYVTGLCTAWNADCGDVVVAPAEPGSVAVGLPADPAVPWPSVVVESMPAGCVYTAPSALLFGADSADLLPHAAETLAAPIARMLADPSITADVVGHTATDPRHPGAGQALSEARAAAVVALFVDAGVDPLRLSATGVGDTQPLAEDVDPATGEQIPEIAAAERRVTVTLKGDESC